MFRIRDDVSGIQDLIPSAFGHGYMLTSNGKGKVAIYLDSEPIKPIFKTVNEPQAFALDNFKHEVAQ